MDEILRITLLYDFYGELLTQKQKFIFEMYYQNDLSLSEIGIEQSISRQAVRDQLKRTEKILCEYEAKLNLVERFMAQKNSVAQIKELIEKIEHKYKPEKTCILELEKMKEIINTILE